MGMSEDIKNISMVFSVQNNMPNTQEFSISSSLWIDHQVYRGKTELFTVSVMPQGSGLSVFLSHHYYLQYPSFPPSQLIQILPHSFKNQSNAIPLKYPVQIFSTFSFPELTRYLIYAFLMAFSTSVIGSQPRLDIKALQAIKKKAQPYLRPIKPEPLGVEHSIL